MKYKTIETLPMSVFLKLITRTDFEKNLALLSDRKESEISLSKHWQKLETEFKKQFKEITSPGIPFYKIDRELEFLRNRFNIIELGFQGLKYGYNEKVAEVLRLNEVIISEDNFLEDIQKAKEKNNVLKEFVAYVPDGSINFNHSHFLASWELILYKFKPLNETSVDDYLKLWREALNKLNTNHL